MSSRVVNSAGLHLAPVIVACFLALACSNCSSGGNGSGSAPALTTLPSPTFTPAAGTYNSTQSVIIADTVTSATIYYTTNGTVPTTSSTRYTGAITVSATETLEAIAVASGYANSSVATAPYTINLAAAAYYVDCSAAKDGNGTQSSPWNSLNDANSHTFIPGDSLLFNRGTTCNGMLAPQGAGISGSPIVIDAYGTGNLPVLNGGSTNTQVVLLSNQSYWQINDLEITGGKTYGVYIGGNTPNDPLYGLHLTNLNVHGATGISVSRTDSGEVFLNATGLGQTLNDVVIDGVSAHDSNVSEGIVVEAGGGWVGTAAQPLGNNVTIQNSTVYNVYGDGILVTELTNGTLENNVVYNTGLCPSCGSTPSGLWEWWCHTCTVQNNESYANQTWGADGGDFDIDYYNTGNIVQYNYGHDSAGYCVANFGAASTADSNNIIRYNVCSNNARSVSDASQGDVYLSTWDGGSLDGIEIYNNTFYWNPAVAAPLLNTTGATYSGTSEAFFKNNIIYSTVPNMIATTSAFALDYNIYWTMAVTPQWTWNGNVYTSLAAYQSASSQESHSSVADPLLNSPTSHSTGMPTTAFTLKAGSPAIGTGTNVCTGISECTTGTQDFFGNPLPANGTGYNIGAYQ
jgi:hypothetical protein